MNEIDIDSIEVVGPCRHSQAEIAARASSIQQIGLCHPITLSSDGYLLAGRCRLEAYKLLGRTRIPYIMVPHAHDSLEARLVYLDENIERTELTRLERAEMLAARKKIYEQLHPDARRGVAGGKARHGKKVPESFATNTAKASGQSERTVRDAVRIASAIPQEVRDTIRGLPTANNQRELMKLARLDEKKQIEAAQMLADGDAKNVGDAVRRIRQCDIVEEGGAILEEPQDVVGLGLFQRNCRRIGPGKTRVIVDVDELGRRRILELLEEAGTFVPIGKVYTLPGRETADLMRQLLREGWQNHVRARLKGRTPQDVVVQHVGERGYMDVLSGDAFAARNLAKMIEEVGELAACFVLPRKFARWIAQVGHQARAFFDDEAMRSDAKVPDELREEAAKELGDVQVAVYCAGAGLGIDTTAEALAKSENDVQRGKR